MTLSTKRPHAVKSFRLDPDLVQLLSRAASTAKMSENSFVANLLTERLRVDPLVHDDEGITFDRETFSELFKMIHDDDKLEPLGFKIALKRLSVARNLFESNNMELTFLRYVKDMLASYGGWMEIEGFPIEGGNRISLKHGYGLRWSKFLTGYLGGAYTAMTGKELKIDIVDNMLILKVNPKIESTVPLP